MSNLIYGKNPVIDAIKTRTTEKVFASKTLSCLNEITKLCKANSINLTLKNSHELDSLCRTTSHQGIVCFVKEFEYTELDKLLSDLKEKKNPLILMLDGIEDPQNFGAIIRSVDAFGADGIIIKNKNQVPVNSTVFKTSTGAINHVKISQVSNLSNAINVLKKAGFWIVSTDGEAKQYYYDVDYNSPICVVVGSEGFGISRLVKENSDFLVKIPMYGSVNSLNASVATGIFLSHIVYSRNKK